MARIYYDKDADQKELQGRRIAIIGYGSQGHAHALNLKESGCDVVVGLTAGSRSRAKAEAEGLTVLTPSEAADQADIVMVLTPDTGQAKLYREELQPKLRPGNTLMFAHGFNIRLGTITPPAGVDVSMVAPWAPRHRVREVFKEGQGTPALLAIHKDESGRPLNISMNNDLGGLLFNGQKRPNRVSGTEAVAASGDFDPATDNYFNRNAWTDPGPLQFGNAPKVDGTVRSFPNYSEDINVFKEFRLRDPMKLRF